LQINYSDCFFNLKSHKGANFPANHQFFTDLNRSNRQKIVFFSYFRHYPAPDGIAINVNCLIL